MVRITDELAEYIDDTMLALGLTLDQRRWATAEIIGSARNFTNRKSFNAYWPEVLHRAASNSRIERALAA